MRPPTACVACRTRRRKCEAAEPGLACYHCTGKGLQCSLREGVFSLQNKPENRGENWHESKRENEHENERENKYGNKHGNEHETNSLPAGDASNHQAIDLPPKSICEELVLLYFQFIHDTFHSLFHKASFMRDLAQETVPEILLFAIISLSARFSSHPLFVGEDPRIRGRFYAKRSAQLLDLNSISVTTVQACVLQGAYRITEGDAAAEAVYYSIACRMAMLLDLPNMVVGSQLEREVNTRIWWSLCMIDVWSSAGVRLPRSIVPRDDVPMPMEETLFLNLRPEDRMNRKLSFISEPSHSLLAQMIKLNTILVEINTANQFAASSETFDFRDNGIIDSLTEKLDHWHQELPDEIRDTGANLSRWASEGLGDVFVAVYLGYYHFGQLLYYQFLHEDSYNDENYLSYAHAYAYKCKAHSINLCEILYRAYATPGCEVLYTMVGHVLVIASTVQLHILLFSADEVQICAARSRLERNFEILTRLQRYWPTLDVCFSRFREFHKVCMKSKETSFRMDRWMLRFLFEFAKPVSEKEREADSNNGAPWSMQTLGFSPY